jgi:hypothetical protein
LRIDIFHRIDDEGVGVSIATVGLDVSSRQMERLTINAGRREGQLLEWDTWVDDG